LSLVARSAILHESKSAIFLKSLFDDAPVKCFPIAPPFENMPVPGPGISSAVAGWLLSANTLQAFRSVPDRTYTLFYTLKHPLGEIYPALIHGPDGAASVHLVRRIGKDGIHICWYWCLRSLVLSGLAVSLVCVCVMRCLLRWIYRVFGVIDDASWIEVCTR
jgi:hypothetical protein